MGDLISRARSTHLKDIRLSSETNAFDKEGCIWPGPRLSNPGSKGVKRVWGRPLGAREGVGGGEGDMIEGGGGGLEEIGTRGGGKGEGRRREQVGEERAGRG